jgi:endonuclease/exonuclease/phosphatase (EEP) superfamily protein YafD
MRLATWNCQTSLGSKWEAIEALDADVLTVQECGPTTRAFVEGHDGWTCEWEKGTYRNGLAVLARSPHAIERREASEPFFLSTMISASVPFRFVGFWARTRTFIGDEYPRQATRLIDQLPDDDLPTVVAGDFNASSRNPDHLRNVETLAARGLVSAYHTFHGINHAEVWEHPTSYFHRQQSRPYHMDYVFVPAAWPIDSVEVGTFEDYPGRGLSDHVPLVVSIRLEQKPSRTLGEDRLG